MNQVRGSFGIDINWFLEYLAQQWAEVTSVAKSWEAWDQESRLDYLNEWPITESYLEVLEGIASQGLLTSEQSRKYLDLRVLVGEARPTIEGLLARGPSHAVFETDS